MHKLHHVIRLSTKHAHHYKHLKHFVKHGGAAQKKLLESEIPIGMGVRSRHALKFKM